MSKQTDRVVVVTTDEAELTAAQTAEHATKAVQNNAGTLLLLCIVGVVVAVVAFFIMWAIWQFMAPVFFIFWILFLVLMLKSKDHTAEDEKLTWRQYYSKIFELSVPDVNDAEAYAAFKKEFDVKYGYLLLAGMVTGLLAIFVTIMNLLEKQNQILLVSFFGIIALLVSLQMFFNVFRMNALRVKNWDDPAHGPRRSKWYKFVWDRFLFAMLVLYYICVFLISIGVLQPILTWLHLL